MGGMESRNNLSVEGALSYLLSESKAIEPSEKET